MTAAQLVKKLREFPPDLEVFIEVNNHRGTPRDIDWEAGGASSWLVIHDFGEKPNAQGS